MEVGEMTRGEAPRTASAAETVYGILRKRIASGRIATSTLLSENEIAQELEVSRTPVREAFVRLESDGWLKLFPKKGALVVPIAEGESQAIIEARELLETHAIASLAPADCAPLAKRLNQLIAAQKAAAEAGDLDEAIAADGAFHQSLVDAARNHVISDLYRHLAVRQLRMLAAALTRDASTVTQVLRGHRRIAKAIGRGELDAAATALSTHLHESHAH